MVDSSVGAISSSTQVSFIGGGSVLVMDVGVGVMVLLVVIPLNFMAS